MVEWRIHLLIILLIFFFFTIKDHSCLKLTFTTGDNDDNGDDDGDFIDDSGETDR